MGAGILIPRQAALQLQAAADAQAGNTCARTCSSGANDSTTGTRSPIQKPAVTPRASQLRGVPLSPRQIAAQRGDCNRGVPPNSMQTARGVTGQPQQLLPREEFVTGPQTPNVPNPLETPRNPPTVTNPMPCNCSGGIATSGASAGPMNLPAGAEPLSPGEVALQQSGIYEGGAPYDAFSAYMRGGNPFRRHSYLRPRSNLRNRRVQVRSGL